MRVLMLGWEFPPHISGGLGTACFGLTQGLAHHGVEVLFVVPRSFGDEDTRFVSLVGADQVPVRRVQRETERAETVRAAWSKLPDAVRTSAEGIDVLLAEAGARDPALRERLARAFELVAIDSPLRPYLDDAEYEQSLDLLAEAGIEPAVGAVAARAVAARVVRTAGTVGAPELVPGGAHLERFPSIEELVRESTREQRFVFRGAYGPDLFAEVARYALVVGEIARRERFDVIHAHDWMTYPAALVAKAITGRPLVLHMHACEYDRSGEAVDPRIRDLEQAGFDGADRIACVSHYTANTLKRFYRVDKARLRVVHNAVTHREAAAVLHEEKAIPEPIVLFLGRITFQKGPDYFIDAAARVIQVEPRVKFVMSGSGDMLPRMIERAARKGLARHMHFTGFLRGREVERMYAMADIYVMPSVSEPFGISPLEAMALDTPVIVSRQSGVSEVLANALKVDFWDVDGMANKILALLRYDALSQQLVEDGREEISRLRWDTQGALMKQVYQELVA
ncbi:MAG: glycosyltransferase [Planctomycetota bacterium]|nr:MAG: glycosyltransferase [Planctomycetota bacterium]